MRATFLALAAALVACEPTAASDREVVASAGLPIMAAQSYRAALAEQASTPQTEEAKRTVAMRAQGRVRRHEVVCGPVSVTLEDGGTKQIQDCQ